MVEYLKLVIAIKNSANRISAQGKRVHLALQPDANEKKKIIHMNLRKEADSIGEMEVNENAYYGVQSLRAAHNFNITHSPMNKALIEALAKLKKAAAITNYEAGTLSEERKNAIVQAADEIIEGKLRDAFIVDAIQGGAGTSANMNANEVIANRAIEILGGKKGDYTVVHPNDHVNMSQSTNDVYPSAGKIAMVTLLNKLLPEINRLEDALMGKAKEFNGVLKVGRTQLQDAVPMRLGQEFHAYGTAIKRDYVRVEKAKAVLHTINMGATAIGTAINSNPYYLDNIVKNVSKVCGDEYVQSTDLFDGTSNLDCYAEVSGALKTLAVDLSKMCNDLRLLSSGPKTGFAEIILPAKQNGSSIMPGKVNPVIPEVVTQVAFRVIGNDTTVTMAAEAGQLELNAFEPIIFYCMLESIAMLTEAIKTLTDNCVSGIIANEKRCAELLRGSIAVVTALSPYIGYKKAAAIAHESLDTGVPVKDIVLREKLLSEEMLKNILDINAMTEPKHLKVNFDLASAKTDEER